MTVDLSLVAGLLMTIAISGKLGKKVSDFTLLVLLLGMGYATAYALVESILKTI